MLAEVWPLLTAAPLPAVAVTGATGLSGPLPVPDLAVGSVVAQLAAARLLDPVPGRLEVDATAVGLAFRSERHARVAGRPVAPGFAPLSRFWRTADGWLRLHGNVPTHRSAALRVLGEDVAEAALDWRAEELETAVVEAGGAAAAVRSPGRWAASEPGRAVAAVPLVDLRRTAAGPVRRPSPAGPRVLDLTRVIAGPVATRTLASHGADVLRVDSPHLPDDPGQLVDTGPGKRHVRLDLATPAGRRTVEDLLATADVVVQGYRPGALARFGLDPGALAERHPHLVVVSLSAWGTAGPWGARRGFDSLVQAATGIARICGTADEPGVLPAQALDHATGHLAAATVLAALARQREEGGGWHGALSLARTAHWLLAAPRRAEAAAGPVDPEPYLLSLPSADGPVTLVAPPGSPPWRAAAVFLDDDRPSWRPRGWPAAPVRPPGRGPGRGPGDGCPCAAGQFDPPRRRGRASPWEGGAGTSGGGAAMADQATAAGRGAQVADVRTARANGIEIAYETFGDRSGRPLVLVMGAGVQMLGWHEDLCRAFADRGFLVVRFDNRDVGLSTHVHDAVPDVAAAAAGDLSSAAYTLEDMADDVAGLLDALGLTAAHVVGVSLGGMVAQVLAVRHPDRVLSLTSAMAAPVLAVDWQAVAARRPPAGRDEHVAQVLQMFRLVGSPGYPGDEEWLADVAGRSYDRAHDPAGAVRQLLAVAASGDRTGTLRAIRVPTLVVHGEADPVVPVAGARATAEAVPGAELLVLPGMGHSLPRALWPTLVDAVVRTADRAGDATAP
ncbi:Crotonobetainyl-CoA:carnitine CoA-transferase CaiB and related acyl-CoA transferases [Geodermatophilus saharensis]|uniref:Crotonobetainyl-CoA:carnitine CoA-transferase CaiB and related acyl-CoA transferases n=1 Tax=Geodermatophilus saharensis TaxID=1137994 RepID=A0A239IWS1_9ACTN|nr:Crotonobetainyl-CoA:carnitine CoA-transferase CaiB and related acyl-CoA transferases [Geodermatophilus saharensis]